VGVLVQDCTQVVAVYYSAYAPRENAQMGYWSLGCGNPDDLAAKCMGHHHVRRAAAALRLQKKLLVDTAPLRWENSRQGQCFFVHDDLRLECRTMRDNHSPAGAPGTSLDSVLLVRMRYLTEVGHSLAGTLASPGVIEDADISTQNSVRSPDALEVVVAVREQQAIAVAMALRERNRYTHSVYHVHHSRCKQGLGVALPAREIVVEVESCTVAADSRTNRRRVPAPLHSSPALIVHDEYSCPIVCVENFVVEMNHGSHKLARLQVEQNKNGAIPVEDLEDMGRNLKVWGVAVVGRNWKVQDVGLVGYNLRVQDVEVGNRN
jgi:hypothetical protein